MILRKPYAILIKYFKIIHIIMFVMFSYIVFVLRKIYTFFSDYVKSGNFTYFEDMTTRYIPTIIFFLVILLLTFGICIYLLMRRKDKPVLFYKLVIGFSSILLVAFIYFFVFFKSLDTSVYDPLRIVINRDIILFLYIINFFFVIVSFIRGFGFDIKKFSFDKDKKELNLEESDSEEYELNVKIEKEEVANYINKQKREFGYYVKENSLVLTIVGVAILLGIMVFLYLNFFVWNKIYHEGDNVKIGKLIYNVNESHITNIDKYGKVLSKDNDYLVVNLSITNNEGTGYLDKQALRIHIQDQYYYPQISTCDMFSDVGECYKNQQLKINTKYDYILVYKLSKEHKKIYMEILKNKGDEYHYSKISLTPKVYEQQIGNHAMNDTLTINNNSFIIKRYELSNKTSYLYEECISEKCDNYVKMVSPKVGEIVLSLEIDNLEKLSDDFLKSAFGLKYNNKTLYGDDVKYIDKHDNMLYFSVPSNIQNINNLVLTITTRSKIYEITLGG